MNIKNLNKDKILYDTDDVKCYLYEYSTEVDEPLKDLIANNTFTDIVLHSIAMHWTDDIQNCPEYKWNMKLLKQAIKELEEELEGKRPLDYLEHWEDKY